MKKKVILSVLIVVLILSSLVGCGNKTEEAATPKKEENVTTETNNGNATYTFKLGHVVTDGTPLDLGAKEFKRIVEEKTNGDIIIEIYPNAALGDNRAALESAQFGVIDFSIPNLADLAGISNTTGVLELPYIISSQESAKLVFESDLKDEIFGDLEENNLIAIGVFSQGWRHLSTSDKLVRTPADMKGIKIRTMDSPIHMDFWNATGASAVPMAFSEVFTSLQQGAIDAQENPFTNVWTQAYHEVQKYIIETAHIYDVAPVVMSKLTYDSLPAEYQDIIREAATEASPMQRDTAMLEEENYKQMIVDFEKCEVIELTDEERGEFADIAKSIYGNFKERAKPELVEAILEAQKGS